MDDFVVTVRQIGNYPQVEAAKPSDLVLLQSGGLGGPYTSIASDDLAISGLEAALQTQRILNIPPGGGFAWNGASLTWNGVFRFTGQVQADSMVSGGIPVVTIDQLDNAIAALTDQPEVNTFNGRTGDIILTEDDVLRAGAAPTVNAHFGGYCTAPTPWDSSGASDQIATTAFVQNAICANIETARQIGALVTSFDGRGGDVWLTDADITFACTQPGAMPMSVTPPWGDASGRIATTLFVDEAVQDLYDYIEGQITAAIGGNYAPINSPQFTGIPTAPTPPPGTSTGQLATTAFVENAIVASTTGVSSFNTRTGAVVLTTADISSVGGALLASPVFTGNPQAPTQAPGTNNADLATCAFVEAAIAALPTVTGVTSWNTRTGAVVLTTGDITGAGGAPVASPAFTGSPTVPTAAPGTNTTQAASTAFVQAAIAAVGGTVTSFNGRTGAVVFQASDVSAVGGAMIASPAFTGTPTAPTPPPATNNTTLATTAFVAQAISAGVAGVSSFNGRSGAVTLTLADVTGVGGAPLASPGLTGVPTAPTPVTSSSDTTVATTAFVKAALAAAPTGVTAFNSRTGSVTLQAADVTAVGGALTSSPTFTGTPSGPTASPGTNTGQLATTAFVAAAITALGGVTTFNGRAGAVTLSAADITGAGGALLASPTFTGTPAAPTAAPGTSTAQIASTAFVEAAVAAVSAGAVNYSVSTFFTAGTATYTTPANSTTSTVYKVRMVGAGGGGGGTPAAGWSCGGPGGAGEYKEFIVTGQAANTAWPITIGAGGTRGTQAAGAVAGAGGATSITITGSAIVCSGGGGGQNGQTSTGVNSNAGLGGSGGAQPVITGVTLILDMSGGTGTQGNGYVPPVAPSSGMGVGGSCANATTNTPVTGGGYGFGGTPAFGVSMYGVVGGGGAVIIERIAG